jgi:nicotinate-nucleotide adenylyltransferase
MTTGLFGGAFDPPHNGHVALARAAFERFGLDRLVVVVTGDPPHKEVRTDAETRFRLAKEAFAGLPEVEHSRHELERAGPSYTVETARWAQETWGDVVLLVGADEFADFRAWKDPDEILEHVRLGVATRPGYPRERLDPVLAGLRRPERVELFEIPAVDVSSTEIRRRVAQGEPIDALVPPGVARLVVEDGLYDELP